MAAKHVRGHGRGKIPLSIPLLCAALLLTAMSSLPTSSAAGDVSRAGQAFGAKMYRLLANQDGNLLVSPFSAHTVLSMAYQGTGGNTYTAFSEVLGMLNPAAAAEGYHQLMTHLSQVHSVTLNVANKIYIKQNYGLQKNFSDAIATDFGSEAQEIDFSQSAAAAKTINDWVDTKTNSKIKDLITPDMLDAMTRLVLVNAVYFKGNWAKQFRKELTQKGPFYLLDGSEIQADMMHITAKFKFNHVESLKAKILELPYEGNEVSMFIVLPDERDGIKQLEAKIEQLDFSELYKNMMTQEVSVTLPKFKIESTIPMNDVLTEMGLGVMFSDSADFSKIPANGDDLKVSKVIQKTFLEVNEEGAEAAAATGVLIVRYPIGIKGRRPVFQADHPFIMAIWDKIDGMVVVAMMYIPPQTFDADRPFVVFIKENKQNHLLFMGRIVRPNM